MSSDEQRPPLLPPDNQRLPPKVADRLVSLLGLVLAGGLLMAAGTLAACRVAAGTSALSATCSEFVPYLERKHAQALDVLLALLAGAGMNGRQ